jgi:hypothetical protein
MAPGSIDISMGFLSMETNIPGNRISHVSPQVPEVGEAAFLPGDTACLAQVASHV